MKDYPIKIYIAGKITGNPSYKLDFALTKEWIKNWYPKAIILNPATLPEGMTTADYMRICLAMIDSADLVVFGVKAEDSKGAKLERDYCEYIDKTYITMTKKPTFIVHCPECKHKPDIGYESPNYYLIDSDTNCPVCGSFTKMTARETDIVNAWNIYAAAHYMLKRKKGDG